MSSAISSLLGGVVAVIVAACGSTGDGVAGASGPAGSQSPAAMTPAPRSSSPRPVAPTSLPVTASPAPSLAPAVPMAAVMPAAPAMTFAIRPLVSAGAAGSVTVVLAGNTASYHVVVTGLAPGSVHAIHDHLGVCGAANRSGHLSVLDVTRANRFGVITFDSTVSRAEAGAGRIVIVYATASPAMIIGCAAL